MRTLGIMFNLHQPFLTWKQPACCADALYSALSVLIDLPFAYLQLPNQYPLPSSSDIVWINHNPFLCRCTLGGANNVESMAVIDSTRSRSFVSQSNEDMHSKNTTLLRWKSLSRLWVGLIIFPALFQSHPMYQWLKDDVFITITNQLPSYVQ